MRRRGLFETGWTIGRSSGRERPPDSIPDWTPRSAAWHPNGAPKGGITTMILVSDERGQDVSRTYLYVPFEERDQARELGAQWDADGKCWFIDSVLDPAPFDRWLETAPGLADRPYSIVSD